MTAALIIVILKKKQSCPHNRLWSPIGVIPVTYEHHLHIRKQSCPHNRPWSPIGVIPVRYEHLHIKK
jgi:hypothetical protein